MNPVDFVIVGGALLGAVWFFTAVRPLGWHREMYLLFWAAGIAFSFIGIAGMAQHIFDMGLAQGYW